MNSGGELLKPILVLTTARMDLALGWSFVPGSFVSCCQVRTHAAAATDPHSATLSPTNCSSCVDQMITKGLRYLETTINIHI